MELPTDLPVTIVIKAPSQRVQDQTVDCMLGWTVKKLKQHITSVYPSQPQEHHQKLIYYGKLLSDHLTLKEVLKQYDEDNNKHTVHLVCSTSPGTCHKTQQSPSTQSSSVSTQSRESSSSESIPDSEGLRYRGLANPSPSFTTSPSPTEIQNNMYNAYGMPPQGLPHMGAGGFPPEMFAGASPGAGMPYSPEQYAWMQQMYAQYMAQYMQYYQHSGYPTPPNTPATPLAPNPGDQQPAAPGNRPANQVRMNANGGAAVDDDDDEFGQRDWLDWVYTFCRFTVLIGIVYFYSNFTRFLAVFLFFFVVYLYQTGWFQLRRQEAQNPREREPVVQQQQQQAQQEGAPPDRQEEDRDGQTETDTSTDTTDTGTEVVPPTGPGLVKIAWTFVSALVTSLFPSPPPPVNVN